MLWLKGWLETRFRLVMALVGIGIVLNSAYSSAIHAPTGLQLTIASANGEFLAALFTIFFAAAGIGTQSTFAARKGVHGSIYFTLSLPVTRRRLLAVRAGLGWLEMAAAIAVTCGGMWLSLPFLRAASSPTELLQYAFVLTVCASVLYFTIVLLATFLDDASRLLFSFLFVGGLWLLFDRTPIPASLNIFRAMGSASPLIVHSMPWTAVSFSLCLVLILFFAALRIVQTREY